MAPGRNRNRSGRSSPPQGVMEEQLSPGGRRFCFRPILVIFYSFHHYITIFSVYQCTISKGIDPPPHYPASELTVGFLFLLPFSQETAFGYSLSDMAFSFNFSTQSFPRHLAAAWPPPVPPEGKFLPLSATQKGPVSKRNRAFFNFRGYLAGLRELRPSPWAVPPRWRHRAVFLSECRQKAVAMAATPTDA